MVRNTHCHWILCERSSTWTGKRRFSFLNQERTIVTAADWNHPEWPKLWLYHAHYHDDLNAEGCKLRFTDHRHLLADWIRENHPVAGNGWEPYPTSLRIVNWVKWLIRNPEEASSLSQSLSNQARWLSQNVEYHLLGNHLWANAKALLFVGCYFEGAEAERWCRLGNELLLEQLKEQVLPDGGHFERSPMYHAIILEDVLDLLQLAQLYTSAFSKELHLQLEAIYPKMMNWLSYMSHPDGDVAFFNDSTRGMAPSLDVLHEYAKKLGLQNTTTPVEGCYQLSSSGFIRVQKASSIVIADVGSVGPSYIPGHAHAGTLSFEWSFEGSRVLVNSGISTYDRNPERERQRSTAAHNTVVVNHENSSDVWASFRVARRARAELLKMGENNLGEVFFEAMHDGYSRLRPPVEHHRSWEIGSSHIAVIDTLTGNYQHAVACFHLSPYWKATMDGSNVRIYSNEGIFFRISVVGGQPGIEKSTWHPGFGRVEPIDVIRIIFTEPRLRTVFKREMVK